MTTLRRAITTTVLVGICGACAPPGEMRGTPRVDRATTVVVENGNWSNMTIYLVRDSFRTRLGSVTSMQTATFRIPRDLLGSAFGMRLEADPLGSREVFLTPKFTANVGERIELKLHNHLAVSNVTVWSGR
ncbi:MAG: hypothetical protein M3483_08635 [Gemmatimonadota bacterium]|nr:hypothetical protein [Gemmatimonadota bacterium]